MAEKAHRYKAFISYSHRDQAAAKWLHRELESYRVPRRLIGTLTSRGAVPRRLGAVFRDRDELSVSADLSGTINDALAATEFLIVLCSPASATSKWVNQEVINFKRLKGADNIICVIVGGEPYAGGMAGREAEECLAPALRFQVDADGRLTDTPAEPIAADLRAGKDGKRFAKLKVIAGLLGVGLDELVRRENQRRQRRTFAVACGAIAASMVMAVLTFNAIQANNDAQRQKAQAEALIEFMLGDLRDKLEPVGRLDVLDSVGERAIQYFATLRPDELDPDTLGRRARALHLLGEIQDFRGNLDQASKSFAEASQTTEEMLARDGTNPQRIFDHAQSKYWIGYVAWRRGEFDSAESSFREYEALAVRLIATAPGNAAWKTELGHAKHNIGVVEFGRGDASAAVTALEGAYKVFVDVVGGDPDNSKWQHNLAQTCAWLADAHKLRGELAIAYRYRAQEGEIYERMRATDPSNRRLTQNSLVAHRALGYLARQGGDTETAVAHFLEAIALAEGLTSLEAENTLWRELKGRSQLDYAEVLLDLNQEDEAQRMILEARAIADRLLASEPGILRWRVLLENYSYILETTLHLQRGEAQSASAAAQTLLEKTLDLVASSHSPNVTTLAQRARSLLLRGDAYRLAGDAAAAQAQWTAALQQFEGIGERIAVDDRLYFATVLARLGRIDAAGDQLKVLYDNGYRSPAIAAMRDQLSMPPH